MNRVNVRYSIPYGFKGSITEVVISNKTRDNWCWIKVWIYARTLISGFRFDVSSSAPANVQMC